MWFKKNKNHITMLQVEVFGCGCIKSSKSNSTTTK
jgi:hypothetical protein